MSEKQKEILKSIGTNSKKLDANDQSYIAGYITGLADSKEEKKGDEE